MSKKIDKKPKINDDSTFIELVKPYCDEKQVSLFANSLKEKSSFSLLLNEKVLSKTSLLNKYKDLKENEIDSLIYSFSKDNEQLGKSLFHFGGGFYIMDSSSALISYYLKDIVSNNPLVIDLCAAPGGKSIAFSFRRDDATIISNDISYQRAIEISKNCERLALTNIYSTSIDPKRINLPGLFGLVILDVPCSGSGMIRKDLKMKKDYSSEKVTRLLPIQKDLLDTAYFLLKKNGIISYSTCSLNIDEDEKQIEKFLNTHKDVEEIKIKVNSKIIEGKYGYHFIPGVSDGEGIYFAFLKKRQGNSYACKEIKYKESYVKNYNIFTYKNNDYVINKMYSELIDLPFISPGLKVYDLSEFKKCEYDHAYCKICENVPLLELNEEESKKYASGEEITTNSSLKDGLIILTYQNMRLGFGKKISNKIKNYLPKGLKTNLI